MEKLFIFWVLIFALWATQASSAPDISLRGTTVSVFINPATLAMSLQRDERTVLPLSLAITNPGQVAKLETSASKASWQLADQQISVAAEMQGDALLVHILAAKTGEFTFPIIPEAPAVKGWILPLFEGVYVPASDPKWISFLTGRGEMDTTADFGLPFLALDYGDATVTYILTNQFNNQVLFQAFGTNHLQASVTHAFTRNHAVKEYAVFIQLGRGSVVEPAKLYREWLIRRGEFVTMKDKIVRTPEAAKLPGAAHVYIWGEELLSIGDVLNWKQFATNLICASANPAPSPGKRIGGLMQPASREALTTITKTEWPDKYTKSIVTGGLNQLLLRRDFYDESAWQGVSVGSDISTLLKTDPAKLSQAEVCRLNCALFAAAFPSLTAQPADWGNGISPKMIRQFSEACLDRLWLGSAAWDGFVNRPETVTAARQAGYLIGTYDSFHSIHSPKEAETWETAQFNAELYQTGAIVNADGSKRHGFKKKGYLLSPLAARPYVEKRVTGLMNAFHANSWFIDCDGFGEFFDDYSEAHPATQQSDMLSRISRMAWIRDTFGAVIGTEGCSAGIASIVHFAHGVMTPVIGWGDVDLTDKKSPYYLGNYYPPSEPQAFFKPVPTKEEYRYIYFDPRFRLPLFETVFHDSVIATHHWSFGSLKTKDEAKTVEMLELLYNVPPLYHLNLDEFAKRKAAIKKHYDFFSPLHRQTALLPMTEFQWLTPDHLIQKTSFGDAVDMVANFSGQDYQFGKLTVPGGSVLARWRVGGKMEIYRP